MGFKDKLYAPFAEVDKRQGRGGYYDYIKWRHVADRMNETFDGRWSSKVVSETVTDSDVVIRIAVTVIDPETGGEFTQEGYGGSALRGGEEAGTAHKGAYSKALKDACRKWGVGLYLETGDSGNSSGGYEQRSVPSIPSTPPAPISTPAPVSQPAPVAAPPTPPTSPTPATNTSAPPQPPAPQPAAPAPPAPPAGLGGAMPAPVQGGMGMAPPTAVTGGAPTPAPVQVAPQAEDPAAGADVAPDAPGSLTEVQKMAITHMAKARGANDEEAVLATVVNAPEVGLTRTVPSLADLTYIEAVAVIKYIKLLNEKE